MTSGPGADQDHADLFIADFHPQLGEYLAERQAKGYDAAAGRARFLAWLTGHASDADPVEDDLTDPVEDDLEQVSDADPVKDYLKQISKVPKLSAEQEADLARRIEAARHAATELAHAAELADAEVLTPEQRLDLESIVEDGTRAKNHLIEANLRLVVSLAKRYSGRSMPFLDLIQEGNLGLIRAMENFDYAKGYKFPAYATWWIRQAITRAIVGQAKRTARISVDMAGMLSKYGREPGTIQPGETVSFAFLQEELRSVLDTLSEREAGVVSMRFGLTDGQPKTLDEIGKVYGLTREQIRQIESKTMARLRHPEQD